MPTVYLIRHGQASFGAADYDVLSETGWEQGRRLGAHLARAGVRPTALVRGGMRRHRETLDAMCEASGWEQVVVEDARWDEFDHLGVIARSPDLPEDPHGMDRREFQAFLEKATERWTAGEQGYDESWVDFGRRTSDALRDAVDRAGSGRTVVVVTSGGVIGLVAAGLLGVTGAQLPDTWQRLNTVAVNSGVTRVLVGPRGTRLLTFNEHEHLDGELLTYR